MSSTHIPDALTASPHLKPMKTTKMKGKRHFQLIDGTFTPAEAARVLLSLVKSKMDYHTLEKFSNEERFGKDLSQSQKRLRELAKIDRSLRQLFLSASDAKQNLKIEGRIEITFVQPRDNR